MDREVRDAELQPDAHPHPRRRPLDPVGGVDPKFNADTKAVYDEANKSTTTNIVAG